jgi:hypothetical protein
MSGVPPDYVMPDYRMTVRLVFSGLTGDFVGRPKNVYASYLCDYDFGKIEGPANEDSINESLHHAKRQVLKLVTIVVSNATNS